MPLNSYGADIMGEAVARIKADPSKYDDSSGTDDVLGHCRQVAKYKKRRWGLARKMGLTSAEYRKLNSFGRYDSLAFAQQMIATAEGGS